MDHSETDDPVKGQLLTRQHQQVETMKEEMKSISERTGKIATTALIAGGVLTLAYILYLELGATKKKKQKKHKIGHEEASGEEEHQEDREPGLLAQIGVTVANQALLLLLDVARTKLAEYVEAQKGKEVEAQ